jgi:hypothetical protein
MVRYFRDALEGEEGDEDDEGVVDLVAAHALEIMAVRATGGRDLGRIRGFLEAL